MKQAKRQRRRHGPQLQRQILDACVQPGAPVVALALAHGVNANLVRR
jgi:transposase-like protein